MTDAPKITPADHLTLQLGMHACATKPCGETASRLARCRCGAVVARCGVHGANMKREREEHCR